ncbi:MAG: hypothetical protein QOG10_6482, partial [Kribbellaceae bacterium]|nr:hypothetical protein [Kribbellaceae bacterium]
FSNPSLTSVAPSVAEIARLGVDLLIRRLDEPERKAHHLVSQFSLVHRRSTIA